MTDFHAIASDKGWSKDERIDVLLQYIENQRSEQAFAEFLEEQVGLEPGSIKFSVTALWPDEGLWEEDVIASNEEEAKVLAKETMADNSCIPFEEQKDRRDYMDSITILYCSAV